jgi:hypothetical protein
MEYKCDTRYATYQDYKGIRFWFSDCNGYVGERNDCGVMSLALASDIPYELAHLLLESFGRKWGGMTWFMPFMRWSPLKWRAATRKAHKLKTFVKNHPRGRYVLITRPESKTYSHSFNVIDGEVWNASERDTPDSMVWFAWEVLGLKKRCLNGF